MRPTVSGRPLGGEGVKRMHARSLGAGVPLGEHRRLCPRVATPVFSEHRVHYPCSCLKGLVLSGTVWCISGFVSLFLSLWPSVVSSLREGAMVFFIFASWTVFGPRDQ